MWNDKCRKVNEKVLKQTFQHQHAISCFHWNDSENSICNNDLYQWFNHVCVNFMPILKLFKHNSWGLRWLQNQETKLVLDFSWQITFQTSRPMLLKQILQQPANPGVGRLNTCILFISFNKNTKIKWLFWSPALPYSLYFHLNILSFFPFCQCKN